MQLEAIREGQHKSLHIRAMSRGVNWRGLQSRGRSGKFQGNGDLNEKPKRTGSEEGEERDCHL